MADTAIVGDNPFKFVPAGIVKVMVFGLADSFMVVVPVWPGMVNDVICLAEL